MNKQIIIYIGGAIIVLILITTILKKLNPLKQLSTKAKAFLKSNSLDVRYHKKENVKTFGYIKTDEQAKAVLENFYKAMTALNTDESILYGYFEKFASKAEVSQFAYLYLEKKGRSLAGDMEQYLNSREIENIADICSKKANVH